MGSKWCKMVPPETRMKALSGHNFAIVDVETTGTNAVYNRIIEIGIVRVEDGKVTKTFSSLINPDTYLSPFITGITGITDTDLFDAPRFEDIAEEIEELLDGCILVAHNAAFDYGFVRRELERAERSFTGRRLCTVRLSRKLFPEHRYHSLDHLVERFGFTVERRHRALDDAMLLVEFFKKSEKLLGSARVKKAIAKMLKFPSLPSYIPESQVAGLPAAPGVYIFRDENGTPLYVGKSVSVRDRVLGHFSNAARSGRERHMLEETRDVECVRTTGEFSALMLECRMIQELQPIYNVMAKRTKKLLIGEIAEGAGGYQTVVLKNFEHISDIDPEKFIGLFRSRKQFEERMRALADDARLCPKLLGLEKTARACFAHQLKKCPGACIGKEKPEKYNRRFAKSFDEFMVRRWPYRGPVHLIEQTAHGSGSYFVVDNWVLSEYGTFEDDAMDSTEVSEKAFNLETYKLLATCLTNPKRFHVRIEFKR